MICCAGLKCSFTLVKHLHILRLLALVHQLIEGPDVLLVTLIHYEESL